MYLLIFLIGFGLIGYYLAHSSFAQRTEVRATSLSRQWGESLSDWWQSRFGKYPPEDTFITWARNQGAYYFPGEFYDWLAGLSPQESHAFTQALQDYTGGLGFELDSLTDDSLKNKPALMQVYVEAVVIYSQAYRRAKESHQQADKAEAKNKEAGKDKDGMKNAEKQASRRRSGVPEMSEAVPAA
jgi:hypothetical protein